jgi:hypothetical protein
MQYKRRKGEHLWTIETLQSLESAFAFADHPQISVSEAPACLSFAAKLDDDLQFTAGCDYQAFLPGGLDLDDVISLKHMSPPMCMMQGKTLEKCQAGEFPAETVWCRFAEEIPVGS